MEPLSALHIHGKLRPRTALVRGYFRIRRWLKPLFQIPFNSLSATVPPTLVARADKVIE